MGAQESRRVRLLLHGIKACEVFPELIGLLQFLVTVEPTLLPVSPVTRHTNIQRWNLLAATRIEFVEPENHSCDICWIALMLSKRSQLRLVGLGQAKNVWKSEPLQQDHRRMTPRRHTLIIPSRQTEQGV